MQTSLFSRLLLFYLVVIISALPGVRLAPSSCCSEQQLREFNRPSRILDQYFGLGLSPGDFFTPLSLRRYFFSPAGYFRPWTSLAAEADSGSTVKFDKDKFVANLDVGQFKPDEISVKVTGDNEITVEGKHEEKEDEHGFVSRQFVRRYVLPKTHDISKVESKLSSDGVLTITAPKIDREESDQKEIPIIQTGQPSKRIDQDVENKIENETENKTENKTENETENKTENETENKTVNRTETPEL